jgi:Leucine-rich repeat (LRR) protein
MNFGEALNALITNQITHINIDYQNINTQQLEHLARELTRNTSVTELSLIGNRLSDIDAQLVAQVLHYNTTLKKLDLSHNSITNTGAEYLARALGKTVIPPGPSLLRVPGGILVMMSLLYVNPRLERTFQEDESRYHMNNTLNELILEGNSVTNQELLEGIAKSTAQNASGENEYQTLSCNIS